MKDGDIRCIAHVINLTVQAALKTLKTDLAVDVQASWFQQGHANFLKTFEPKVDVINVLAKLRRHIYIFRNHRALRDALQKQAVAHGLKEQQLSLDMPVRWNSTCHMLELVINLWVPITELCASQELDSSMKDIARTAED
ncbi:hypothetical protein V502_02492 [Pseudogymnoascus sp. VKM F-4520 (FW-2644)]|nr:hypothetical protein V502_02492 [Pseudogymnoascus sp. VKM F-4520 (FW-2644)]